MALRASGCVRLAHALRAVIKHRGLNVTELTIAMDAHRPWNHEYLSRARCSQWLHAHRAIPAGWLMAFEKATQVKVHGVFRNAKSTHHATNVCRADLASGVMAIPLS